MLQALFKCLQKHRTQVAVVFLRVFRMADRVFVVIQMALEDVIVFFDQCPDVSLGLRVVCQQPVIGVVERQCPAHDAQTLVDHASSLTDQDGHSAFG